MKEALNDSLQQELVQMAAADQDMRNRAMETGLWDESIDRTNTERLRAIVATYGWPTSSKVGAEGARAAWLIAQHADHDVDFQSECLDRMKQEPTGEVSLSNLAYLEDRVRVNRGQEQLYGTQFYGTGETLKPQPIADEAHLDERRASVGLGPFSDYAREIEEIDKNMKR